MIRSLPSDGVVREPGAYRIPIKHYHSQAVCPGVSVSSGPLRTIDTHSPADVWEFHELNPNRTVKPDTEALIFGRASHSLLLGEDVFDEHFVVLPEDAPARPTKAQIAARIEGRISASARERFNFWDDFDEEAAGRDVIPHEWMADIFRMSCALHDHPLVGPLFDGESEVSLIWQDRVTGLWLKCRPDCIPSMGDLIADLKTCSDARLRAVDAEMRKYRYPMQFALAAVGMKEVFDQDITGGVAVFIQKKPPFHVTPISVDADALHWNKLRCRKAINTFARCVERNDWPGPVEGIPEYRENDHELHLLGEAQERGEFPRDWFGSKGGETEEPADV